MAPPGSVRMEDAACSSDDDMERDSTAYGSESGQSQEEEEQEDEEEDFGLDGHGDCAGPSSSSGFKGYKLISSEAIAQHQEEAVESITPLMACSRSSAKLVLMFYRWNREKVATDLVDRGPEYVFRQAGVVVPNPDAQNSTAPGSTQAPQQGVGGMITCGICCYEVDSDATTTMDCGHTFCNDCWRQHFKAQIGEAKACSLRCMAYKCGAACDLDKVHTLLRPMPAELSRFEQACLLSFIEDNQHVRTCPSQPWCGRAIQVEGDAFIEPECSCGTKFCFKCGREPHSPCTCHMWALWDEKTNGDSETRNWISANTKTCPKCNKPVEKNGGCNHVTCKCGQSFCWHCGQATGMAHTWTDIKDHSCGRYKEEADRRIDEAQRTHKRYMHYFEHWKEHVSSHAKEKAERSKLLQSIQEKMEGGVDAREYNWLECALNQLQVARGVLAPTYPFAYFFFGHEIYSADFSPEQNSCNQKLFEDQQGTLEAEVERLSGLVQKCSENLEINPEERVRVINSSVSIQERIIRLYDLIETDLFGKLLTSSAQIAVYKPKRNLAG